MRLPPLEASEFAEVFAEIHGLQPFPWQQRLATQLAVGGWPEALDLPTGSGKTAAIDIALFHLALEATRGQERQAPLRIAFVVDRRIIVDAAADRAERIAAALSCAEGEGPLARMAGRLRHLAGEGVPPLLVRRLRGGLPREEDWARSPGQPTMLCSTVDQVGSRLLFRGYGVSDSMKPVHAGLLGSDCLFLLDEAHLATPFAQTLRRIAGYRAPPWCESAPGPWGFVSLSATQDAPGATLGLDDEDRAHPVLRPRLEATKPAELHALGLEAAKDAKAHAEAFAQVAMELLDATAPRCIAVVVNRVALARGVFERIKALAGDSLDLFLLTGRIRDLDRDALLRQFAPRLAIGAARVGKPLIVVATQTIEAGADFDFDALVTQASPLDALRQRFGRPNRGGRAINARAIIIAAKDEIAKKADDSVYGDRTAKTWAWLNDKAEKPKRKTEAPVIDFGIAAMEGLLASEPEAIAELSSEKPQAPVLRPADLLLLSWTAPTPAVDPAVALFLHGPNAGPADFSIVWRADVTAENLEAAAAWVALAPPHAGETLTVPLWAARAWLSHRDNAGDIADLEGAGGDQATGELPRSRRALHWAAEDNPATGVIGAEGLRPGDTIIVPAGLAGRASQQDAGPGPGHEDVPGYGGCDRFGWNPASGDAVSDLGDQRVAGRRAIRRLHPDWPRVAPILAEDENLDDADRLDALARAGVIEGPRQWRMLRPKEYPGVVLLGPGSAALTAATEDDSSGSVAACQVGLSEHTEAVRTKACAFAIAAGLPPVMVNDLELAALLHDGGKADPRFQATLLGGDRLLAALAESEPLAKSARPMTLGEWRAARLATSLPERWRHEAQSVTRAMVDPRFATAEDPELVLWLIGTHHGQGRPLFPHHDPREAPDALGPQRLDFQFRGFDWPQIFERLKARYGPWELARLEAVLRLADHRASAEGGA